MRKCSGISNNLPAAAGAHFRAKLFFVAGAWPALYKCKTTRKIVRSYVNIKRYDLALRFARRSH